MASDRDRQVKLRDGRALAYVEYGAPDGKPVFYFHGHPGSRRDWSAFDSGDAASDLDARIIAIDRPGHGLSDFKRDREILDWPDDVTELADALGLSQFAVLGVSGGGPYAAACAFKIPERLSATAIVSGMGPAHAPGSRDGLAWRFAAGRPAVVRSLVLTVMSLGLRYQPEKFVAQVGDAMEGADHALLLAEPELAKDIIELSFIEAFRGGIRGVRHDARLYARPWGFQPQDIEVEVHLWHGREDKNVPVSVGSYMSHAIPNCHARFIEDQGHFSLAYNRMREILAVLVADGGTSI
jgi:pimeloyl-ACP methyl ester carboxylesterase